MWNFTRSRQTAGNICLVLFTAFLFTILVAPFGMVGAAEAATAPTATTFVENGQPATAKDVSTNLDGTYYLLVNLALDPLTQSNFNTMEIKFDFGSNKVISVYAKDIVSSVYNGVYTLVYTPSADFKYPTYTVVYGKVYVGGSLLQDLILTMNLKPPVNPTGNLTIPEGDGTATLPTGLLLDNGENLDIAAALNPVGGTSVTLGGVVKDLTSFVLGNGQTVNITNVTSMGDQPFTVNQAITLQSSVTGQPIVIGNPAVAITISIPDGTTIMAPAGWGGLFTPPTAISSVSGTAPAGYTVNTANVMKFGADVPLLFSQPVTVILPNVNSAVAYKVAGSSQWVKITTLADGTYANPTAPAFPGEAYISDGTNTKIITWHATEFAAITAASAPAPGPSPSSSSTPTGGALTPAIYTFGDIAKHWAKDDIQLLVDKGIVAGISANNFAPDATITRAQFATLLVKALGIAEVKPAKATFKDVKSGAWYYGTVEAAAAKGLVAGSKGSFRPEGKITRQEMAVMVAKALKVGGKNVTADASVLNKFSDKSQIASWAQSSVAVAVKEGIISGRTATTVVVKANATRAEGTVMIKKVLSSLGKL